MLLCRRHHRSVHEDLIDVRLLADGSLTFIHPDGTVLLPVPYPPALVAQLEALPLPPQDLPTWDGTPFNLGYAVEVLYTPPASD